MKFVFLSLQAIYTDRESTSTSLAKELSKNHEVLYINPAMDRKTSFLKNLKRFSPNVSENSGTETPYLVQKSPTMWVLNPTCIMESVNWIPSTIIFSIFNRLNNRKLAIEIKKTLEHLNFDSFILINDKDIFRGFYLKELLNPLLYIYLDRDYTIGFGYWKRHGTSLEPILMAKSDAVICNSIDFTKRASKYNPNSYYIGNGVDLTLFNNTVSWQPPEEFKSIPKPIIGYVGAILTSRLDATLIIQTAKARPDWSFVMIGWEDETFEKSELHEMPNVFFLGRIHKDEIPQYMKYFDVCTNPQVVNEITIGNFPLKIIEYLALGKPVVAITTNTMKEVFSEFTYLADTATDYQKKLELALSEDSADKQSQRVKFAKTFGWNHIAEHVETIVAEILMNRAK